MLSYLETVRRDGWSKDDEGKVEMTSMYWVVYVFTPPANRSRCLPLHSETLLLA